MLREKTDQNSSLPALALLLVEAETPACWAECEIRIGAVAMEELGKEWWVGMGSIPAADPLGNPAAARGTGTTGAMTDTGVCELLLGEVFAATRAMISFTWAV